ncbi:hypothetical protein RSSM_00730, partial [Rhodopirellula sallentina SM41]
MPPSLVIIGDQAALSEDADVPGDWGGGQSSDDPNTLSGESSMKPLASAAGMGVAAAAPLAASAASAGAGAMGLAGLDLEEAEPTQSAADPSSATVEDTDFSQMETVEEDDTIAFQATGDTLIDDNTGLEELSDEPIAIDDMEHADDNSDQLAATTAITPESMNDDDLSEF